MPPNWGLVAALPETHAFTLGQPSPWLMMGMLQTRKVSCGGAGGNWEGLRVLVPLQPDWDSLQKDGAGGCRSSGRTMQRQGTAQRLARLLLYEQIWGASELAGSIARAR